jgi:hypothetical protein
MDTTSVVETIATRIEQELARVRAARPSLSSRISRAENILVTHLSCRRQHTIRVRVRDGRPRFLVSGSGGAVYVVDPSGWSCTCPDAHRRGKGCKHSIACWALWRASARPDLPASAVVDTGEALAVAEENGPYEVRACSGCFDGLVYDGERGAWVGHDDCSGTGRARVFVYARASKGSANRLRECAGCRERFAGRELVEVGPEQAEHGLQVREGEPYCRPCARQRGVL